jgi:hypothetical protein
MRRIAGRLGKITDDKAFPPRERSIAKDEYEKYGEDLTKILPQYLEAVEDHHRQHEEHQDKVREREKLDQQRLEEERAKERQREEEQRQIRMMKALELEKIKAEIVGREDFLEKPSKMSKAKQKVQDMEFEDFIDDEAGRARLDRNKKGVSMNKKMEEVQSPLFGPPVYLCLYLSFYLYLYLSLYPSAAVREHRPLA